MNGYLLDTHVVLRWVDEPAQLSAGAREAIAEPSHTIYVSAAASWEMGIKKALGRLEVPESLPEVLESDGIRTLPISFRHGLAVASLPDYHRDPFDRMMVAQATAESLVLVTRDALIHQYNVALLKA